MSNETAKTANAGLKAIIPVMFAFFVMGFVDLVGTATNYVKGEFALADGTANLFTTMVFFWFLIFSVPTGMLMNKIGRRKTVLWSILVTLVAMALPIIAYTVFEGTPRLVLIVASFAFLGIGNTLMQVSLNPLLTVFVKGDKLASTLTTGQFVKAFASLFAPYIAIWGANQLGMWWILFVIYFVVGVVGYILLALDKIEEPAPDAGTTTIAKCFKLLGDPIILLCFLGIVSHVGVDVGINAQAPRILTEHTGDQFTSIAATATMVYFVARMIGCFTGGIVLQKISNKLGVRICGVIMTLSAICFAIFTMTSVNPPVWLFWVAVALVGFGNSNVFSLFLSHALMYRPERQNEISGLMLMGLIGGAIFPPIMGVAADAMGQFGGILVMAVGCVYVLVVGVFYKVLEKKA
ncbi:MFS transporter [Bifidobacterium vespertilionis]|uniref:MFS transporter n=1 Tax=Bifidobacterium vespertilionis TaxID=2562524 RepID=A0A5J5E1M9_9BIFI|nr:MFS transporter [Bifidobacterium vespertilionis]KAA8818871.1 MFS transporter [Bifidobacterium vespertilionis]KAA8823005.1 MFS transporter [Bifidobacterium vespertilionis]